MNGYAHPQALVSTDWVAEHLRDKDVVLVEVDADPTLYGQGHLTGAVGWDWTPQLAEPMRRDVLSKSDFEKLTKYLRVTMRGEMPVSEFAQRTLKWTSNRVALLLGRDPWGVRGTRQTTERVELGLQPGE